MGMVGHATVIETHDLVPSIIDRTFKVLLCYLLGRYVLCKSNTLAPSLL